MNRPARNQIAIHMAINPPVQNPTNEMVGSEPTVVSDGPRIQPSKLNTKDNLVASYLRIFREFRRRDLTEFCDRHESLYHEAIRTGDHIEITQHYYDLMADVIETYYGDGWHFCPPEYAGQSRADATTRMYESVADLMLVKPGSNALDIGCGVGGMLRHVAQYSGADLTGMALSESEVQQATTFIERDGLTEQCQVVQGDCQAMQFESSTFDAAFATYSLKHYTDLNLILGEIARVLKPGGRFVAYCLCKSDLYDEGQPQHRQLLSDFEYSTAMPPLHSVQSMTAAAEANGLTVVAQDDLSNGELHWYSFWVSNPVLPWMVSSRLIYGLAKSAEAVKILPKGFARFNDTFLAGTLRHIIQGGKTGVLTGSALLTFEKPE